MHTICFVGEDLTKILPTTLPIIYMRAPMTNIKSEFFVAKATGTTLINNKLLDESLSKDVVQKRFKDNQP